MLTLPVLAGDWSPGRVITHVQIPELNESSGLVASRAYPGVFWSHNDSGGGPYLFAFDRSGRGLGRWRVAGARNIDWEDLSVGPGPGRGRFYLYIGDIGDNFYTRKLIVIYRVPEPDPTHSGTEARAEAFRLRYPDVPHDAEALLVHPRSGEIYVITKARGHDAATRVFKAVPPFRAKQIMTLKHVTDLRLPGGSLLNLLTGRVTGGAVSADGRRVMLCDYNRGWEAVLPAGAKQFDTVWRGKWTAVDLGTRDQGESVAYGPGGDTVFATSEGASPVLVEAARAR